MDLLTQVIEHPRFSLRESEYLRWYPKTLLPLKDEPAWVNRPISGAYIHVPFCDKICRFCPFNKALTDSDLVDRFVHAVQREILMLSERVVGGPLDFIYFGGGTPSVLDSKQISGILEQLDECWGTTPDVEITLETHPTHALKPYMQSIASVGVNRISTGIQSFQEHLLSALGATHKARDSRNALDSARSVFDNVAIDLLYRYHPQTMREWLDDLTIAVEEYDIPHLSCYALVLIGPSQTQPSVETEVEFAVEALNFGSTRQREHYASCASGGFDLSQPKYQCKYERQHWTAPQKDFVGLGPGAFGFAGGHSTVNRLSTKRYCDLIESGRLPLASALPVDLIELKHRYFALGVKTLEVSLTQYRAIFGTEPLKDFLEPIATLQTEGLATVSNESLKLTPLGGLFVDSCSTLFFSDAERYVPHPEEPEIRMIEAELSV